MYTQWRSQDFISGLCSRLTALWRYINFVLFLFIITRAHSDETFNILYLIIAMEGVAYV